MVYTGLQSSPEGLKSSGPVATCLVMHFVLSALSHITSPPQLHELLIQGLWSPLIQTLFKVYYLGCLGGSDG